MRSFQEASNKNRNVPNADDKSKTSEVLTNPMGHGERRVDTKGEPPKQVLNEVDPDDEDDAFEESTDQDEWIDPTQLESRGLPMKPISEKVQDHNGVKGDFMEPMGGKTDQLGASQTNTGHAYEQNTESSSGSPDDGIQTNLQSGDLGQSQKNTGGTFEEFGQSQSTNPDDTFQDSCCGDMAGELGQNNKQKNKGGQHEPFNSGNMSEEWSIDGVADIMEEDDVNLQDVFNGYADQADLICLEDFQTICDAYGLETLISEDNLESLMDCNDKFVFYEGNDDQGQYWIRGPIGESFGAIAKGAAVGGVQGATKGALDAMGGGEESFDECGEAMVGEVAPEMGRCCPECQCEPCECVGQEQMDEIGLNCESDPFGGDDIIPEPPGHEGPESMLPGEGPLDLPPREPSRRPPVGGPRRPFEGVSGEGDVISEMTTTAGVAAPPVPTAPSTGDKPMGKSIATGTEGQRNRRGLMGPDDEESEEAKAGRVAPTESTCKSCGCIMDSIGCPGCDLLREAEDLGLSSTASTDENGRFTSDATTDGLGGLNESTPGAETQESTSTKPDDGITTELGGMGKELGQNDKVKNKGGQAPLKGGSGAMQENVMRLARAAKPAIEEAAAKIGRVGKYAMRFSVACEGIETRTRNQLTEALVDVEELMQAYGPKTIVLEAHFHQPKGGKVGTCRIPLTKIKRRDPIVSENKVLFRFPEVANDFADKVVNEGITCRVKNHNWGSAVNGRFSWGAACQAFKSISEDSRPFV